MRPVHSSLKWCHMLSMSDHGDEDSEAEESESEPEIEAGVKHSIPRQTGLRRLQ